MTTADPVTAELGRLPDRIAALLNGRSEDDLRRRPSPGEWSVKEIACHLRDGARIYHERLARTLGEDRPLLPGYDEMALAAGDAYQNADTAAILPEVREWRDRTVSLLSGLPAAAWERPLVHEEEGEMTLIQLAAHMIEHESMHVRDIARLLRAPSRDA